MLQAILQNVNPEAASGLEEVIKQVCVENSNKFIYIYIYIYIFLCQKKVVEESLKEADINMS